jgi:hypothetical protein
VPVPNCLSCRAGDAFTDDPLRDPSARREKSNIEEEEESDGGMMKDVRSGLRAVEMMGGEVRMRKDV